MINTFTQDPELQVLAHSVIWLIAFNSFPDALKGMLRGAIKGLGIQNQVIYINLAGHWLINLNLQYFLAFRFGYGMLGMWIAKTVMETFVCVSYLLVIEHRDWNKSIEESNER
jgi:MATE family multidrug resistance protein